MIVLNNKEVQKLLTMGEAIDIIERAYMDYSLKKSQSPLRYNMQLDNPHNFALFMPGITPERYGLGLKFASIFPKAEVSNNVTRSVILLSDRTTGVVSALISSKDLTILRTGASTGAATKYLASKHASSVAIIGTGRMASGQLEAVCCVRNIKEVFVYNRTIKKAQKFVKDMKTYFQNDITYFITSTPKEAVEQADIIVTATESPIPVVKYHWLKKDAHVNAIGSFKEDLQEVDEELVIRAEGKFVDGISAASVAGDLAIPLHKKVISKTDLVEIGDFINNNNGYDSSSLRKGITLFKSVGLSVLDIAIASTILEKAVKSGVGIEIDLD